MIRPVHLSDLAIGERYVLGEFDQPYRLSDALTLPGAELRGSAFYFFGDTEGQVVRVRELTLREKFIGKKRTPVDDSPFRPEDWK